MKTLYVLICCFFAGCTSQSDSQETILLPLAESDRIGETDEKMDSIAEIGTYENIGSVSCFSGLSNEIARLLSENEIDFMITGSRAHAISVSSDRAEESRLILQKWRDQNDKDIFIVGD